VQEEQPVTIATLQLLCVNVNVNREFT